MISIEQINGEISLLEQEMPTHAVMQKLANLYTVRDHIIINSQPQAQTVVVANEIPNFGAETEFAKLIEGTGVKSFLIIMDDLMTALQVLNPALYRNVMQKLEER